MLRNPIIIVGLALIFLSLATTCTRCSHVPATGTAGIAQPHGLFGGWGSALIPLFFMSSMNNMNRMNTPYNQGGYSNSHPYQNRGGYAPGSGSVRGGSWNGSRAYGGGSSFGK